jgi:omega-6 fatty acid desaturase (delta-12 desaturase)
VYRLYRGPLGQFVYYFVDFWLRRMIFPTRKELRGRYRLEYVLDWALVTAALVGWVAFLVVGARSGWFGGSPRPVWNALLFGLVIPQAVWNTLMSTVIYLHHTHPELRWYNDEAYWAKRVSQADTAVHVVFPGPVNMIFHWIMEHNAHHARPGIPLYNLPAAQRFLERESNGKVIVFRWTLKGHLDIIRRCKLYDFDRACWLDFQGRETSVPAERSVRNLSRETLESSSHEHQAINPPHILAESSTSAEDAPTNAESVVNPPHFSPHSASPPTAV